MKDTRLFRVNCEYCGRRVTVGACGRVYKHKDKNGRVCYAGMWVKVKRPESTVQS